MRFLGIYYNEVSPFDGDQFLVSLLYYVPVLRECNFFITISAQFKTMQVSKHGLF